MESKMQPNDIPTALPGVEDEEVREKLLAKATATESETDTDEADLAEEKGDPRPTKKSGLRVMRTIAGFGVFVGLLALAISWFFGMGWFTESKAQPVSRNSPKDGSPAPVTEDEKLKMAMSIVASEPKTNGTSPGGIDPDKTNSTSVASAPSSTGSIDEFRVDGVAPTKAQSGSGGPQYGLPPPSEISAKNNEPETTKASAEKKELSALMTLRTEPSADALGRSLFFGVIRKPPAASPERISENTVAAPQTKEVPRGGIPFGTLLPVRLAGSIYTLKNSGGIVRLELTRPVEGKGFSYPAGTVLVGNARGGESARAFVTVIGLIDPVSGELVKFGGDLLGKDGASGIEGRRRRLTRQWARFFSGLKETASSVLGSVGALRSGGTVILSEPMRRGSESMSEDLSEALLANGKVDTFIEVAAGSNGYVLVTDLPESSSEANTSLKVQGADK